MIAEQYIIILEFYLRNFLLIYHYNLRIISSYIWNFGNSSTEMFQTMFFLTPQFMATQMY
jgi:hypothetical protein